MSSFFGFVLFLMEPWEARQGKESQPTGKNISGSERGAFKVIHSLKIQPMQEDKQSDLQKIFFLFTNLY